MKYYPMVGDLLTRPKALGLIRHEGVWLGSNRVATNTPEAGECIVSLQDFAAGQCVSLQATHADLAAVARNAERVFSRPRKYNVLFRNCQHTASEIIHGVPRSALVLGW